MASLLEDHMVALIPGSDQRPKNIGIYFSSWFKDTYMKYCCEQH